MPLFHPDWRPRRSALFVPTANQRALEKARGLDCDCLILDLEDSVAPGERAAARAALAGLPRGTRQERIVRISAWDSEAATGDLDAALACGPDAILLPKLDSPDPLFELREALGADGPSIWAMIESPAGLIDLRHIVGCAGQARLEALVVGPNDLAKSTGVRPGPDRLELVPWLMQIIAAARAFGLVVLDGVFNDFADDEGFRRECIQSARMGFDGKTLIHPAQIGGANEAFLPDAEERRRAQAIVEAFELEENTDKGVIQIEGEMVERLHLEAARRLLDALKQFDL